MKKLFFVVAVLASFVFAEDKTVLEVCKEQFCYEHVLTDVKAMERMTDFAGNKFLRVYFYDKRVLDIKGDSITVITPKNKKKRKQRGMNYEL